MQCRALCLIKIICPISFSFFLFSKSNYLYLHCAKKPPLPPPPQSASTAQAVLYITQLLKTEISTKYMKKCSSTSKYMLLALTWVLKGVSVFFLKTHCNY